MNKVNIHWTGSIVDAEIKNAETGERIERVKSVRIDISPTRALARLVVVRKPFASVNGHLSTVTYTVEAEGEVENVPAEVYPEILEELIEAVQDAYSNGEGHLTMRDVLHELTKRNLYIGRRPQS